MKMKDKEMNVVSSHLQLVEYERSSTKTQESIHEGPFYFTSSQGHFPFHFHFHLLGMPIALFADILFFFSFHLTPLFLSSFLPPFIWISLAPSMAAKAHGFGFLYHAILLLLVFWPFSDFNTWFTVAQDQQAVNEGKIRANQSETIENKNDMKMIPVPEIKYLPWACESDKKRRKLAPFQLCSGCTCCGSGSNKSICTTSACCYSITCGLPDKPYGVCAFTPKACDCTNCGV